jgi:hypothetical protein
MKTNRIYVITLGVHYWNTCSWSSNKRIARRYTRAEARTAIDRMEASGERAWMELA